MSNVLIVSRTRMSAGNVCVGGLDISNGRSVRLLTSTGSNQLDSSPYQVGDIWDMVLTNKLNCIPPHNEDVLVVRGTMASSATNIQNVIRKNSVVNTKPLSGTFENTLIKPCGKAWSIERSNIPPYSVCFWETPTDLKLTNSFGKLKYQYSYNHEQTYLPYVGTANSIPTIVKGTIVRLSLARWWAPPEQETDHCYLQLSGWY